MSKLSNEPGFVKINRGTILPETVKIGDAAKTLGVSIDTLRRWEKSGKVKAIRTPGGTRLYSTQTLNSLSGKTVSAAPPSTEELLQKVDTPPPAPPPPTFTTPAIIPASTPTRSGFPGINSKAASFFSLSLIITSLALLGVVNHVNPLAFLLHKPATELSSLPTTHYQLPTTAVLAASSSASFLEINSDTTINGNLTAPNIVYGLTAGTNISITGDPQRPVISSNSTETLASVTARGATTSTPTSFTGGVTLGNSLNLGQLASDPGSAINGATYYNTTSNQFRCYINGSWVNCDTQGSSSGGTVTSITAGNGLSGGTITDSGTISVNLATSGTTATTSSTSGLEVDSSGLRLLGGCSNNQVLEFNSISNIWACTTPSSGLSGSGTSGQVAFFNGASSLTSSSNFTFNSGSGNVGIGGSLTVTSAPVFSVLGSGIVFANSSGGLSSGNLNLSSSFVTGVLGVANGGTNSSTSQGAINNISQLTTNGDLLYFDGTNSTRLPKGATGQCLNATALTIAWGSCGTGGSGADGTGGWFDSGSTITELSPVENVGIGTSITIARAKLELQGNGNSTGLNLLTHNNANTVFGLVVLDNGNVGVGTTNINYNFVDQGTAFFNGFVGIGSSLNVSSGISLSSGQILAPNGTTSAPSYSFTNSTGIGLWSPVSNTLALTTGTPGAGQTISGLSVVSGNVGIGTSNPSNGTLDLVAPTNVSTAIYLTAYGTGINPNIIGRAARGSATAPTASQADDYLNFIGARGYGASGFAASARSAIGFKAGENWTDSSQGSYLTFETTANGTASRSEKLRLSGSGGLSLGNSYLTTDPGPGSFIASGNIGIGTSLPTYNLQNAGTTFLNGFVGIGSSLNVTGNVGIGGTATHNSLTLVGGNIVPTLDATYDLGSAANRFNNLYLANNINGTSVTATAITDSSLTQGSVIFAGAGGLLSQSNANFFFDATNKRLGIGTSAPSQEFQVNANASNPFVVTSAGNVGIGTTIPGIKLSLGTTDSTLGIEAQPAANTTGGSLTIQSGAGNGTGNGGAIALNAGVSGATGTGGNVTLTAGSSTGNHAGGDVNLTAGNSTGSGGSSNGGGINISGGQSSVSQNAIGGAVTITGGAGTGGNGVGGALSFTSGSNASVGGATGAVTLASAATTAVNNNTAAAASGAVTIKSGAGSTNSGGFTAAGASGNVTVQSSNGGNTTNTTGGASGTLTLSTGNGGAVTTGSGTGGGAGTLFITGGNGGGTNAVNGGAGAGINITAGNGGTGSTTGGTPGNILLTAGNAGSGGNLNGGNLYLVGGTGTGTGSSGNVLLAINSSFASIGNVGIGTSGPGSKLSVSGNEGVGVSFALASAPSNGLAVQGNVGIGTTTASHNLEVIGSGNFSGALSANTLSVASTTTLSGLSSGSGSALCLDGSNNVITCTTGVGGISGSGFSGGVSFFNGTTSVTANPNLFFDSTNSRLGIGTSAPSQEFQVNQNTSNPFVVTSGGNVGIGTTSPAGLLDLTKSGASPTLYLNGAGSAGTQGIIFGRKSGGTISSPTASANGEALLSLIGQGYTGSAFGNSGDIEVQAEGAPSSGSTPGRLVFFTTPSGSTTLSERMRIDATGNVGINTAAPNVKLEVVDSSTNTNFFGAFSQIPIIVRNSNNTLNTYSSLGFYGNSQSLGLAGIAAQVKDTTNFYADLVFGTRGSGGFLERMRIDQNGNVGIGTSIPTFQLQTTGNAGIGGSLTVTSTGVFSSGIKVTGTSDLTGNVGVGGSLTISSGGIQFGPDLNLHRSGANSLTLSAPVSSSTDLIIGSGGDGKITAGVVDPYLISNTNASTTTMTLQTTSTAGLDDIIFKPAGTESIRFTDTGNVGIGFSSPTSLFQVNSGPLAFTVSSTGNVGVGASLTVSSLAVFNGGIANTSPSGITTTTLNTTGNVGLGSSTSISSNLRLSGQNCTNYSNGGKLTTDASGNVYCAADNTSGGGGGVSSLDSLTGALTLANSSGVSSTITIDNAAADGSTKGIAAFNSTNFTASSGVINTIQDISTASSPTFNNLTLNGFLGVGTSLNVTGNVGIGKSLNVTSAGIFGSVGTSTLNTTGLANFGSANVSGNLGVGASVTSSFDSTTGLNVTGLSNLNTLNVNGTSLFRGALTTTGNVSIGQSLNVTSAGIFGSVGATTLNTTGLANFGTANVSGNLGVGASITSSFDATSGLNVTGLSNLNTLNATGNVGLGASLTLGSANNLITTLGNSNLNINTGTGIVNVAGSVGIGGSITFTGINSIIRTVSNNNLTLDTGTGSVIIGSGGLGKITAGTFDPPYIIDGTRFATYLPGMTGVKEETAGVIQLVQDPVTGNYSAVLDFANSPKGSDLWLFKSITDWGRGMKNLVVLLSGDGNSKVWYQKDPANHRVMVYGNCACEVSYRLTAPRFDWADWPNVTQDQISGGFLPNNVNDNYSADDGGSGPAITNDPFSQISFDKDGNLVIPKLKVTTLILDPSLASASASLDKSAYDLNNKIASLEDRVKALEDVIATASGQATGNSGQLAANNSAQPSATSSAALTDPSTLLASDSASLASNFQLLTSSSDATVSGTLTAEEAQISDQLTVLGDSHLSQTSIAGDLTVDGTFSITNGSEINAIPSLHLQSSPLAESADFFNGLVTIDKKGNLAALGTISAPIIKTNQLTITNAPIASSSATLGASIGSSTLPATQTKVTIQTTEATDSAKVFITPTSTTDKTLSVTNIKNGQSFDVSILIPAPVDIKFNWWIVQTK